MFFYSFVVEMGKYGVEFGVSGLDGGRLNDYSFLMSGWSLR